MAASVTLAEVATMDRDRFSEVFGGVYESSPQLAGAAWAMRPFADVDALCGAFADVADALSTDDVLELLRAHPQLGARTAMADVSRAEQRSAGIHDADDLVSEQLRHDNARYLERFGFPFILAVRGRSVPEIVADLDRRLANDPDTEREIALAQVKVIAHLRIEDLVGR